MHAETDAAGQRCHHRVTCRQPACAGLCGRFTVPAIKHSPTPAVFTQAGFVIGTDIAPASLGKLFALTLAQTAADTWRQLDEPEQLAAAREIDRRYQAITLAIVLGGG